MKYKLGFAFFLFTLAGCSGSTTQTATENEKRQYVKNVDSAAGVKNDTTTVAKRKENKYMSFIDPIKSLPEAVLKLIPDGYLVLDTAIGDLDLDGTNDMLLVVKNKFEDTLTYPNDSPQFARPLLILIGKPDGTYSLAKRNDSVIMAINSSGFAQSDPFTGLKIKNGFFSVEHGVSEGPQHWELVTTFKYDKEQREWFLFKEGNVDYEMNDSQDPDADAMKKVYDKVKTKKDFGVVPFEKYVLPKD